MIANTEVNTITGAVLENMPEVNKWQAAFYSKKCINIFDLSFIAKSGNYTPGLSYFWCGCGGKAKIGLEIGGFTTVDITNNTALHLVADQTLL